MKFEEKKVRKYILSDCRNAEGHIYFLVDNGEVVYVGQTVAGISRPLQHTDKVYDTFYMKKCAVKDLDKKEREMILKYKPKYNKAFVNSENLICISKISDHLFSINYGVRTFFLRREIEKLGIKCYEIANYKSYHKKDLPKIVKHIKNNYSQILKEQEISISKVFVSEEADNHFCLHFVSHKIQEDYGCLGTKSIKDLYYLGKITENQIENWRTEYEKEYNRTADKFPR
jgi:hypothetical protein